MKGQYRIAEERRATRVLLATDQGILNHGQVTRTTPELAPPLLTTIPHQQEDELSIDLTCIAALHGGSWWYWARTHDMPAMIRYLDHWAIAALGGGGNCSSGYVALLSNYRRNECPVQGRNLEEKTFDNLRREKQTATAGSDVVQSGRSIFDDFFQHLWPYIGNNTANVVFQMVKRLWLIRIDQ
ncbi:hypothetical protein TNCV_571121 [Trichonephila clavipes]|nr:hypothetical protein TNCV_571121 [Trichonephila clavipes]